MPTSSSPIGQVSPLLLSQQTRKYLSKKQYVEKAIYKNKFLANDTWVDFFSPPLLLKHSGKDNTYGQNGGLNN